MTETAFPGRIDEAALAGLFTEARTVKNFATTPVTDEELAAIWDLAQGPPTAANTQPLRALQAGSERNVRRT
jgi:3-hydroxypropanoate dehydrogenase